MSTEPVNELEPSLLNDPELSKEPVFEVDPVIERVDPCITIGISVEPKSNEEV